MCCFLVSDPEDFRLEDCSTQRKLKVAGVAQTGRIDRTGKALGYQRYTSP